MLPANKLPNMRRRVSRTRRFMENTCPASRHLHQMAEALAVRRPYPMLQDEPDHCAASMLAVLESLWKTRTAVAALVQVVERMDLYNEAERPTEAEYRAALRAARGVWR